MTKRTSVMMGLLAGLFLAVAIPTTATAQELETHKLDKAHCQVMFRANHLGISYVFGRFKDYDADIKYHPEDVSKSTVNFSVKTASVETFVDKRDKHIQSPDFLNAKKFPEMTFESTKVERKNDNTLRVSGKLTIRDVTKPISIDIKTLGEGKGPRGNFRRGWYTEFDINRFDFGVDWNSDIVKKELRLILGFETIRQ